MSVVTIYVRIYLDCLRRALASIGKSLWTLLLPMGLLLALRIAGALAAPFGQFAGLILGLVLAALGSCYLYFLGELVGNAKVQVHEFGQSVKAYFWPVASVMFIYWIASWLVGGMLQALPQAHVALELVTLVLLNAVPEVIYQRQPLGGLAAMQGAIQFLQSNLLQWGVPNVLLLTALWFVNGQAFSNLAEFGYPGELAYSILIGALFHVAMVFRGRLFAALDGTSHRQRMFRYRTTA
jgi:hypothetical protein